MAHTEYYTHQHNEELEQLRTLVASIANANIHIDADAALRQQVEWISAAKKILR